MKEIYPALSAEQQKAIADYAAAHGRQSTAHEGPDPAPILTPKAGTITGLFSWHRDNTLA